MSDIRLITAKINKDELKRLVDEGFKDMVKFTVDVKQKRIAIGGSTRANYPASISIQMNPALFLGNFIKTGL